MRERGSPLAGGSLRRRPLAAALGAAVLALLATAAGAAGAAGPAGAEAARPVEDPHYGDGLFHFFQEQHFDSLASLMVSQHFERLPHHADEAEVLRGGLLLSYGLHREAGQIFAGLIDKGAAPAVRDRAWYFLAKIRFQRGLNAEAEQAIDRIERPLPGELEDERGLLHAQLLMARADFNAAARQLGAMTASKHAGRYARFNLGVALVRSGDAARGSVLLDELGTTPAANEEQRSLRDRANVALGFAALGDDRPQPARAYLERVRLESPQANKALLGFGWAAAALDKPELALVPWTELAGRDASDAAVLEARIALPYAYAELGALGQALTRYQEAIAAFEREGASLDESIAAIRAGKLEAGLIDLNPERDLGWLHGIRALPEMPHANHLAQVLAEHEFQEAFKNYRDLRLLTDKLLDWQDKLGVYGDMLGNRRTAYEQRLPQVRSGAQAGESGLAALQPRRDALHAELAQAAQAQDGSAFANAKERELQARLDSVRASLALLDGDPAFDAARQRARLAAGSLAWQLAQAHPSRAWDAKKALAAIDLQLAQARERDAALAEAQRAEPARHAQFASRIAALAPRLQVLIPHVSALAGEQRLALQSIAVTALTRQKERLAVYATQARFAVAQLHDRASLASSSDAAPQ